MTLTTARRHSPIELITSQQPRTAGSAPRKRVGLMSLISPDCDTVPAMMDKARRYHDEGFRTLEALGFDVIRPATATTAPVVGGAIAAATAVPGCATGASHEVDIAAAVRFVIEVAKDVGAGTCRFYDEAEFSRLVALYGDMRRLQGGGAT